MKDIDYKKLLNITSDWVWAIDKDGFFTYCSENVIDFTEYAYYEIIDKSPLDFVSYKEKPTLHKVFSHCLTQKSSIKNLEFKFTCKDGSPMIVLANAVPILNADNTISGFEGTCKDITKQREAENFLENVNASLSKRVSKEISKNQEKDKQLIVQSRLAQMGEMISMIAHQWRQPLGAISATSINMQMKIELGAYDLSQEAARNIYQEYLHKELTNINDYVQTLTNTIDDFRNFYKPNKQVVTTQFKSIITKSLSIIKASLTSNNINVILDFISDEEVKVYENEIMQVILNILQNAHDNFLENKINDPYIIIKTEAKSIYILDNGGGIPENIIENIFDPYFSTKKSKNGTGLGLYMSKTIVEEHHNGILSVTNKNNGACFKITLF